MDLGWVLDSDGCSQKFGVLIIHVLLRLKHCIDKLFIGELAVKVGLEYLVIYLRFHVIEKFIAYPCPDMERGILAVSDITTDRFHPR